MRGLFRRLIDLATLPGTAVISVLLIVVLMVLWIFWAIDQMEVVQVRAITVAQHDRCATMPHGDQEMEERKHECWKELYEGSGPWKRVS